MMVLWLSCFCLAAISGVVRAEDVDSFVIGGQEVYPPGSYPYQCALYANNANDFNCGCVVITNRHVLTAAHCVEQAFPTYDVLLGAHDQETQKDGQPELYALSAVVQHPGWVPIGAVGFPNDIAVLTLAREIDPTNPYIEEATMPPEGNETYVDFAGQYCNIIGWGQTAGTGTIPNVLREANIDVLTNQRCQALWNDININEGHICIYDEEARLQGACFGDSGGALICKESAEEPAWTLAGLTSWVRTGCDTNWPSVYTRVSYFRTWVEEQIGNSTLIVEF